MSLFHHPIVGLVSAGCHRNGAGVSLRRSRVQSFGITHSLRGSTIGEGGDTMISSPGRSPKQPLPGIGLYDPLHGRQACLEFIAFDKGFGHIYVPGRGYFRDVPSQNEDKFVTSLPPPIVELVRLQKHSYHIHVHA